MRVAVFGVGGIGGFLGGKLAASGVEVAVVARGEHLAAMQHDGLYVESPEGNVHGKLAMATSDPAQVGVADFIIMGVKAWQVPEAAAAIRPMVGPQTQVLTIQNGVEAPEQIAAAVGRERVLAGVVYLGSIRVGPGRIRHLGIFGPPVHLYLGALHGRPSAQADALAQMLRQAGLTVPTPPAINIHTELWTKLAFVSPSSSVSAATRSPGSVIRSFPGARRLWRAATEEIMAVAAAQGVVLPADTAARNAAVVDRMPTDGMASMARDMVEGRPSELECQVGDVVRLGAKLGVPAPVNSFLYDVLLPQETKVRG